MFASPDRWPFGAPSLCARPSEREGFFAVRRTRAEHCSTCASPGGPYGCSVPRFFCWAK